MPFVRCHFVLAIVLLLLTCGVPAEAAHLLKANIADIAGRPVAGAKLFLYDSPAVRRPADFISPLSDSAGRLQIELPPGRYWVVARYKADGKYGPLLPGDRHSGEPLEVDLSGGGAEADFVVADIREIGQKKRAGATDALRLKGLVVDTQGLPVARAVVYANRSREFNEVPEFISVWTEEDGRYELFLPPDDSYYLGTSRQFPLQPQALPPKLLAIDGKKIDIAIDIDLTVQ